MKKALSLILCMIILATCFSTSVYAKSNGGENTLIFNKDGKFTILNISDIQDGYPLNPLTKDYIERTVDKVKPDLIVLTGDNISGYDVPEEKEAEKAIREFMDIFQSKNIKVAQFSETMMTKKRNQPRSISCLFMKAMTVM